MPPIRRIPVSQDDKPPPVDLGEVIRSAQDQLAAVERVMVKRDDDSAPIFRAMATFAGVLHQFKLENDANTAAVAEAIESVKAPLSAAAIDDLNKAAARNAVFHINQSIYRLALEKFRGWIMWGVLGGLALMGLSFGGGVLYQVKQQPVLHCQSSQGGVYCGHWIVDATTR